MSVAHTDRDLLHKDRQYTKLYNKRPHKDDS